MFESGRSWRQGFAFALATNVLWLLAMWTLLPSCRAFPSLPSESCSHPINPELRASKLTYDGGRERLFMITGCADRSGPAGLPVILAFHGGGQSLHNDRGTGFLDYTALRNAPALVVAPEGQVSWNGHTWSNAFPWLKSDPDDDHRMTEALVAQLAMMPEIPPIDRHRIFALGKSDGAGMAISLACRPSAAFELAGIAAVSGAYFGLGSPQRFGIDDGAICLPQDPVPLLLIHGTSDRLMPFTGQKFINPKAIRHAHDYWFARDPDMIEGSGNTYTADLERYAEAMALGPQNCSGFRVERFHTFSKRTLWQGCKANFETIWVDQGDHVWEGHPGSGPGSSLKPNLDFDATREIFVFFGLLH